MSNPLQGFPEIVILVPSQESCAKNAGQVLRYPVGKMVTNAKRTLPKHFSHWGTGENTHGPSR
jgi:hypothetical protein